MDTLKAISAPPDPSSRLVQTTPKKNGQSVVSVATVATATASAKLTDQKAPENKQQVSDAVKEINSFFQMTQRSLAFNLDEDSGQMVMQIRDAETHDLIRQIPGEDVLKLAQRLNDLSGVLFKAQA